MPNKSLKPEMHTFGFHFVSFVRTTVFFSRRFFITTTMGVRAFFVLSVWRRRRKQIDFCFVSCHLSFSNFNSIFHFQTNFIFFSFFFVAQFVGFCVRFQLTFYSFLCRSKTDIWLKRFSVIGSIETITIFFRFALITFGQLCQRHKSRSSSPNDVAIFGNFSRRLFQSFIHTRLSVEQMLYFKTIKSDKLFIVNLNFYRRLIFLWFFSS